MAYNPLTHENNWEIQTAEKGMRYAVVRAQGKGDVAFMPYGLTQDCKALATMISATPELYKSLNDLIANLAYDKESGTFKIDGDSPHIEEAIFALSKARLVK